MIKSGSHACQAYVSSYPTRVEISGFAAHIVNLAPIQSNKVFCPTNTRRIARPPAVYQTQLIATLTELFLCHRPADRVIILEQSLTNNSFATEHKQVTESASSSNGSSLTEFQKNSFDQLLCGRRKYIFS